jgi:hypothetical protein
MSYHDSALGAWFHSPNDVPLDYKGEPETRGTACIVKIGHDRVKAIHTGEPGKFILWPGDNKNLVLKGVESWAYNHNWCITPISTTEGIEYT